MKADTNDDDVAHEIALALTEASQRGGSPQASQTPNRRSESVMSSPARNAETKVMYILFAVPRMFLINIFVDLDFSCVAG